MKSPLWKLLNEFGEADIDRGYIMEILVAVIQEAGIEQTAIDKLNEQWGSVLEEYRKEVGEEYE